MMASRYSRTDSTEKTVQILIDAGADLNIKNNDGKTAQMLHNSSSKGLSLFEKQKKLTMYMSNVCSICYEHTSTFEKMIALIPCGHTFCCDCFEILESNTCSMCRSEIENSLSIVF